MESRPLVKFRTQVTYFLYPHSGMWMISRFYTVVCSKRLLSNFKYIIKRKFHGGLKNSFYFLVVKNIVLLTCCTHSYLFFSLNNYIHIVMLRVISSTAVNVIYTGQFLGETSSAVKLCFLETCNDNSFNVFDIVNFFLEKSRIPVTFVGSMKMAQAVFHTI